MFQGSAIGPHMFVVSGIDLKTVHLFNTFDKYADGTYLIVPADGEHTIQAELDNMETSQISPATSN